MAIYQGTTLYAEENPDQVSSAEITAGTEEGARLWSPEDVKSAIDQLGKSSFSSLTDTPSSIVADQYVRGSSDGNTLVFSAAPTSGGGSTTRSFVKFARPGAAVNITTPTGSATQATDQWTPWTSIESLPAITAAEAGTVVLAGDANVMIATASNGGGDRFQTQIRLMRTRASVDTVLVSETIYGPRNMPFNADNTSGSFAEGTRESSGTLVWTDTAAAGDVYSLEARVVSQQVSGTRDVTFSQGSNGLLAFAGSGGSSNADIDARIETWARTDDTTAIPRDKQQIWIGTQSQLSALTRQEGWIYITSD